MDTASEALAVSIGEKAKVDIPYMRQLTGKTEEEITEELAGVIFKNPLTEKWEPSDEYLSGNVREKLSVARAFAENRSSIWLMCRLWNECSRKTWMHLKLKPDLVLHGFPRLYHRIYG